uniref:Coiled-coil domain-containing protein 25 n=1 Tax=Strongyloides papillosus TaxID=174720 RepID=A0A0N5C951_STREA
MVLAKGQSALRKVENEKEGSAPFKILSHIPECVAVQKRLEELKEQQKYLQSILSRGDNKIKIPKTPNEGGTGVSTVLLVKQDNSLRRADMKKRNIWKENAEKAKRGQEIKTKQVDEIRRSEEQKREEILREKKERELEEEETDTVWDRTIVDKSYGEIEIVYETPK